MPDRIDPKATAAAVHAAENVDPELAQLCLETAEEARQFLGVIRQVASGTEPEQTIPLLLLGLSQVLVTGARLGAINDIMPAEQFEPDLGSDVDVDAIREKLAEQFGGLDEYAEVIDPLTDVAVAGATLSGELADIAEALLHGLRHAADGRVTEALWWWQFSYLSDWGSRATGALRAVQSIMSHIRLDADEDTVAEAQFDALHN